MRGKWSSERLDVRRPGTTGGPVPGPAGSRPTAEQEAGWTYDAPASEREVTKRRGIIWLLLVAGLLYAVPFGWGLTPGRDWAFDEPRPEEVLPGAFEAGHVWPLRYPPLHRLLLSGVIVATLPVARWASATYDLDLSTVLQLVGRASTIPFALATLLFIYLLARRLGGARAGWLAALFWLGVAPQAYYAKTMNLDAPYVAWFALSLLFFLDFRRHRRRRDLVGFALASGAAVLTKDQAYGLYVLPAVAVLYWLVAEHRARGASVTRAVGSMLVDARPWTAAAAVAVEFMLAYRVWRGFEELVIHVREITGWHAMGRFQDLPNSLAGHFELAAGGWRDLTFCLGSVGMALAGVALVRVLHRAASRARTAGDRRALELLLFPLSYYVFFISVVRYSFDRFFLPIVLVLALCVGPMLAN